MISQPLVSICIPTFNGAKFIREALSSVLNQTYQNIEIIISDDRSDDDTVRIITELLKSVDIKIKFRIYYHKPSTIGANWNNSINKARGEYIKLVFQDDNIYPSCIEKLLKPILRDEGIGLVGSKRNLIMTDEMLNFNKKEWIDTVTYKNISKNIFR